VSAYEHFHSLPDRLGRVHRADSGNQTGSGRLIATTEQIVLEYLPDDSDGQPRLISMPPREVPEQLIFVDRHGLVGLDGCRLRRASRKVGLPSWTEVHADHAIEIKSTSGGFTSVNCLRSEIAGLATWTTLTPVVSKEAYVNDDGLLTRMVLQAKAGPPTEIGTTAGLRLVPYFDTASSQISSGGHHAITEKMFLETRFEGDAVLLDRHLATHRDMQELLVIAYGQPCGQRLFSVASRVEPRRHMTSSGVTGDHWRGIISAWRGRGGSNLPMELPSQHTLFDFPDIGASGVRRWIDESPEWARIVGPLVQWTFDAGSSVEVEIIQIGIALEALGHNVAVRQGLIERTESQSFPQYLKRVRETLSCDVAPIVKGSPANGVPTYPDFDAWSETFGALYKQAKHADHPLPDVMTGAVAARSGALLLRMWLAQEFGVDPQTINENAQFA
jgi:hypothetical protein